MYKKGFTLIELLAVIVIMGIILAIAIPSISIVIENSKEKAWKNQQKLILDAAEKYVGMNPDKVPQEFETIKIKLEDLISANLIDKDIKNPKTNEIVDPNREVVAVTNEGSNKIKYTFIEPNDDENPGGGEEIPGGGAILDIAGEKNTEIFVEGKTSHHYLLQLQNDFGLDGGKIFNGEGSILLALIGFKQANTDLERYLGDYQCPFNSDLKCFFYEFYDSEEPVELIIDSVVIN